MSLHHAVEEFWPTPIMPNGGRTLSPEAVAAKGWTDRGKVQLDLGCVARLWPTPASADGERGSLTYQGNHNPTLLGAAVGLWPTAGANDWKGTAKLGQRRGQLDEAVEQLWATPRTAMCLMYAESDETLQARGRDGRDTLPRQAEDLAKNFPTPRTCAGLRSSGSNRTELVNAYRSSLPDPLTGRDGQPSSPERRTLNPLFVEWLEGFPEGWTACAALATPLCLSRLRRHLRSLLGDQERTNGPD